MLEPVCVTSDHRGIERLDLDASKRRDETRLVEDGHDDAIKLDRVMTHWYTGVRTRQYEEIGDKSR
ncbi:MAG: hypothetical protein ABIT38_13970, partial [Gemmatimonadaceae bacterium]